MNSKSYNKDFFLKKVSELTSHKQQNVQPSFIRDKNYNNRYQRIHYPNEEETWEMSDAEQSFYCLLKNTGLRRVYCIVY